MPHQTYFLEANLLVRQFTNVKLIDSIIWRSRKWLTVVVVSAMAGCGGSNTELETNGGYSTSADGKIKVTTTVNMVGDLVREVGGDHVEVSELMGPGVDPHLFKASAGDVGKLVDADVVFYVGLLLEGKIQDTLEKVESAHAVAGEIDRGRLLKPAEFEGHFDPHIWFDIMLWIETVDVVVEGLGKADPEHLSDYKMNGETAKMKMRALHEWVLAKVKELPKNKRILITSHDAYNYFARAYDFQVVGLQGISTVSEPSLADVAKMVDFIDDKGIKAIFVESSVSPAAINRISQDSGAKIGGELFSDAMGARGKIERGYDLGTYEGMIKHNLNTIVEALK